MNLLRVHELATSYETRSVFAGVSFSLAAHDRLAVLGASGSGKTSLLRLLAGLDQPSDGHIERAPGLRVSMVFQDLALWPNLSAVENVALALPGLQKDERRRAAEAALKSCQVGELASRRPGTLSIGQQQRVALARAIAAKPQMLLLDEPFSSLDPLLRQELTGEVRRLLIEIRAALVLVTHDPWEALSLADRALVLEAGRVVENGDFDALLAAPQSRLLRHFAQQMEQQRVREADGSRTTRIPPTAL